MEALDGEAVHAVQKHWSIKVFVRAAIRNQLNLKFVAMTTPPKNDTAATKIEKRRSWSEISTSGHTRHEPLAEDYSAELDLFELGEIDKHLWAKCLVQSDGDTEKAKWQYIKDKAASTASLRAEESQQKEKAKQKAELEAKKKAELEAEKKANLLARQEAAKAEEERLQQNEKEDQLLVLGWAVVIGFALLMTFLASVSV